ELQQLRRHVLYFRGLGRYFLGHTDRASEDFIEASTMGSDRLAALALYNLASIAYDNEPAKADALLARSLQHDSTLPDAHILQALVRYSLWNTTGDYQASLLAAERYSRRPEDLARAANIAQLADDDELAARFMKVLTAEAERT